MIQAAGCLLGLLRRGACGTCCGTRGSSSPPGNDLWAFQQGPWLGQDDFQKQQVARSHLVWEESAGLVRSVSGALASANNACRDA